MRICHALKVIYAHTHTLSVSLSDPCTATHTHTHNAQKLLRQNCFTKSLFVCNLFCSVCCLTCFLSAFACAFSPSVLLSVPTVVLPLFFFFFVYFSCVVCCFFLCICIEQIWYGIAECSTIHALHLDFVLLPLLFYAEKVQLAFYLHIHDYFSEFYTSAENQGLYDCPVFAVVQSAEANSQAPFNTHPFTVFASASAALFISLLPPRSTWSERMPKKNADIISYLEHIWPIRLYEFHSKWIEQDSKNTM